MVRRRVKQRSDRVKELQLCPSAGDAINCRREGLQRLHWSESARGEASQRLGWKEKARAHMKVLSLVGCGQITEILKRLMCKVRKEQTSGKTPGFLAWAMWQEIPLPEMGPDGQGSSLASGGAVGE